MHSCSLTGWSSHYLIAQSLGHVSGRGLLCGAGFRVPVLYSIGVVEGMEYVVTQNFSRKLLLIYSFLKVSLCLPLVRKSISGLYPQNFLCLAVTVSDLTI
ncbi:hypothetical protein T11_2249 [Trichinella zimbabwensis]|uniref:Uncharacterized protein n=1 Tax=Trichinella zimbabwensis TaxID=268475 RepID=A0A0V1I1I0_9BILA|nr:hypothetical protein T11_2249 [Trichinella zimbabwensis]